MEFMNVMLCLITIILKLAMDLAQTDVLHVQMMKVAMNVSRTTITHNIAAIYVLRMKDAALAMSGGTNHFYKKFMQFLFTPLLWG